MELPFKVNLNAIQRSCQSTARVITGNWKLKLMMKSVPGEWGHTDNKKIVLNPYNSARTKAIWLNALEETTYHESWHMLYTDFKAWKDYHESFEHSVVEIANGVANLLEDGRIEHIGVNMFEGSLETVRLHRLEDYKRIKNVLKEAKSVVKPLALIMLHIDTLARVGLKRPGKIDSRERQCIRRCIPHIHKAVRARNTKLALEEAAAVVELIQEFYAGEIPTYEPRPEHVFIDWDNSFKGEEAPEGLDSDDAVTVSVIKPGKSMSGGKGEGKGSKAHYDPFSEAEDDDTSEGKSTAPDGFEESDSAEEESELPELDESDLEALAAALEKAGDEAMEKFLADLPEETGSSEDAMGAIEKEIRKSPLHKNYSLEITRPTGSSARVNAIIQQQRLMIEQTKARLADLLLPKKEDALRGRKSGSLDVGSLWRLPAMKETHVFQRSRIPSKRKDVAVMIVVDESGSTNQVNSGVRRYIAEQKAAIGLTKALLDLGCNVKVIGFDEESDNKVIRHRVFVDFGEKDLSRLSEVAGRWNNRDGYSIRAAGLELAKRSEQVKLLLVLSDGEPAANGYVGPHAIQDTRLAVDECRKNGLVTVGFYVGDVDKASFAVEKVIFGNDVVMIHDLKYVGLHMARILKSKLRVLV